MDSGVSLEEYFREQISKYLPSSLEASPATVIDSEFYSCGECDIVIYDPDSTPPLKFPATESSRHKFIPTESTYGIFEIKETLRLGSSLVRKKVGDKNTNKSGTLKLALEKAFSYKELSRVAPLVKRSIETTEGPIECAYHPFTLLFFYKSELDLTIDKNVQRLLNEFLSINRNECISMRANGLFILDQGAILWLADDNRPVYFPEDSGKGRVVFLKTGRDTLYLMYSMLSNLLRLIDTQAPFFNIQYGGSKYIFNMQRIYREGD